MRRESRILYPFTEISNSFIIDTSLLLQFIFYKVKREDSGKIYYIPKSLKEFTLLSEDREQYFDLYRGFLNAYSGKIIITERALEYMLSKIKNFSSINLFEPYDAVYDNVFQRIYYKVKRRQQKKNITFKYNDIKRFPTLNRMLYLIGEGFNYEDAFIAEILTLMIKTKKPLLMHLKKFVRLIRNKITLLEPARDYLVGVLGEYYSLKNEFDRSNRGFPKGMIKFILTIISANSSTHIGNTIDFLVAVIDP